MERSIAEGSKVLVPAPAHISFPWEDSNNEINLQCPVRNTCLRSISDNEAGFVTSVANEPLRERRRWARPHIVQTISSNSGNTREEKNQYENKEKYFPNRHCSRDNLDTHRMTVACASSKDKYQHRTLNSESIVFQSDFSADEKQSAVLDLSDRNRSLDDQIHDNITESPVAARIPSPSSASSITSGKRLEWDSGADVGYHFIQDNNIHFRASLSTIERIALARGCSAALFERLEPEGTSGPSYPKPSTHSSLTFDSPIAKSTPVYKDANKINSRIMEDGIIVEPSETVLPGGYIYLHAGEEFDNEVAPPENLSSQTSKTNSGDEDKVSDVDTINKKHSNSLTNISCIPEDLSNTVPRSQSYLNLLSKEDDRLLKVGGTVSALQQPCTLAAACSVSSSSVATIVQKPIFPKTSDKFIQTIPLKLSVGVQVSENIDSSHVSDSGADVQNHAVNFEKDKSDEKQNDLETVVSCNRSESHKHNNACKKQSVASSNICQSFVPQNSNFNLAKIPTETSDMDGMKNCLQTIIQNQISHRQDKELGTLESATSSTQTVGSSCVAGTSCSGVGINAEGPRDSAGIVGSVNSFEYLPGDVFEITFKSQNKTSTPPTSTETSSNQMPSDQIISVQSNELCNHEHTSASSSLNKDIEEGVELLQKLMSDKAYNGRMKKKLIRQVINKLVYSDYPEDFTDNEKLQRMPLSSNVPWTPATPNSQPLKNVGINNELGSGDSNQRNSRSVRETSMHSSGGRPKGRSVVSVSEIRSASSSCTPSGSLSVPGDNEESRAETSEVSSSITSRNIKRDWKLPTSRSEKDYEEKRILTEKHSGTTPPLLRLCKTEHEKQLQWIRFEIDHLTHLKQLLEKQEAATRTLSNLTGHEHKFHKIKQVHRSTLHNSDISRFKVAGTPSNSTEYNIMKTNDSSLGYTSSNSKSSSNVAYRPASSEFSVQSPFEEAPVPHVLKKETFMKKNCIKHDFSTQTPTLDSFVLHSVHGMSSDIKGSLMHNYSSNEAGRLNVYVQTSPKDVRKHSQTCRSVSAYARTASENASESAVKCCCDCKRILDEVVNVHTENSKKMDENVHMYCKCNSANKCSPLDQEYPSTVSHDLSVSDINDSKSSSVGYHPQKRNIATETVVNKSIQTSSSLHEVPIVKHVWNMKNESEKRRSRNLENKVNKYCPCCGLPEMQSQTVEKHSNHSDHKKGVDVSAKHLYERRKGKSNLMCNVSIQTSVKEPLAYLLTFEPTCQENTKLQNRDSLPEIKLLVPISQSTLENELKRKVPVVGTFKENQSPPDETKVSHHKLNACKQPMLTEKEKEKHKLTLQEYLRANRPDYIQHADKRTQCLTELALLRDLRKQKRLELMTMTERQENEVRDDVRREQIICSGGLLSDKPKLTSRMMREQSRRKYKSSREIQDKLVDKKRKEDFRTNRLMAELFTKKLQKKVLQGVVNHSNSASVVSSVL